MALLVCFVNKVGLPLKEWLASSLAPAEVTGHSVGKDDDLGFDGK